MKLLLVFTFLALACIAQSAPSSLKKDRVLVLPDYHADDTDQGSDFYEDNDLNSTTTTTTTTTRRSTYMFTKLRSTEPSRKPWLTQRSTSTIKSTTYNTDTFDDYLEDESFSKYFKQLGQYFKKIVEEIKRVFRNINLRDLIKTVQRFFNPNKDD